MKYQHTAKGLASLGRNGDDTLLHVNKKELEGLQALLGPISVNPETGLPEAFRWGPVVGSLTAGLLGAFGGAPIAAALGMGGNALAAGAAGAGIGSLTGGAISAAQGHGFAPGALGGAISGGMGGWGGADLPAEGASKLSTQAVENIKGVGPMADTTYGAGPQTASSSYLNAAGKLEGVVGTPKNMMVVRSTIPGDIGAGAAPDVSKLFTNKAAQPLDLSSLGETPSPFTGAQQAELAAAKPSELGAALSKQGSSMMSKKGMEELIKPIGIGTVTSAMIQEAMIQNEINKQQQQQADAQAQANAQDTQNYFTSLGYPLPTSTDYNSPDTATQRNYFLNKIYPSTGYAAGGPVTMRREVMGIPVQTIIPAKYVDEFERTDLNAELPEAYQGLQAMGAHVGLAAQKAMTRRMANGGYLDNTVPTPPGGLYPQSLIPQAQPKPGATPVRQEVLDNYAEGGSVYEKGGFLDGPGDGMSDDIPANIDGQEEVRLADGEFVIPPEIVNMLGYGDPEKGAKMLDKLLPMVRQAAHGKKEQVKQDAAKGVVEKALVGGLPKKKSLAAEKAETRKKARG